MYETECEDCKTKIYNVYCWNTIICHRCGLLMEDVEVLGKVE